VTLADKVAVVTAPEEIAAVAVLVASDAAKMINGVDLLVDGDYTIR
jgi:hypothetical protein